MHTDSKIFVAGARGLVGSALVRELRDQGFNNLLTPTHAEGDLTDPVWTKWFFSVYKPEYVFFAAAKVGGIAANASEKVEFFTKNMQMELNVITNAAEYGVRKLLFLGTSCVYPRDCPQPIKEEYLLTGPLEATTEAYSIAKIAGMKLCEYYCSEWGEQFITALPCNIFGERDNFNPLTAHCIPGLMARLHHAKVQGDPAFEIWGDGKAMRELIFAEDLARGLIEVMRHYHEKTPINVGSGFEMTMYDLATTIAQVVEYKGGFYFNSEKPSGTPRKVLDNSKAEALGWRPMTPFLAGLQKTYEWYKANCVAS